MELDKVVKAARKLSRPYRVTGGKGFRLKDADPGDTAWLEKEDKPRAKEALQTGIEALAHLQDMLYAQDRWGVLLVFQAMDAAGKDGAIKHVMSGVNPQGCQVSSFKSPSAEELDHDYLWRCNRNLPERGRIGIFNRSYYEEVLVTKVHPEIIEGQKIPARYKDKQIFERRYEEINNFEKYLVHNGIVVLKFFLNVSREEQKKRFLERIDRADKNWKFSVADAQERTFWGRYIRAYEECFRATSTKWAPWHVVPADNKWFTRVAVADVICSALADLKLAYPTLSKAQKKQLVQSRTTLLAEK